jgi:hypothetical protein
VNRSTPAAFTASSKPPFDLFAHHSLKAEEGL